MKKYIEVAVYDNRGLEMCRVSTPLDEGGPPVMLQLPQPFQSDRAMSLKPISAIFIGLHEEKD